MTLKSFFSVLILGLIFTSCTNDPLNVDVSDVQITVKFHNVHSELYNSSSKNLIQVHNRYKKNIPEIYNYYLGACMEFPQNMADTSFVSQMNFLKSDPVMKDFEIAIGKKFSNLDATEAKLIDGFKHLKYHFPKEKMPTDIIYINSRLQSSVFCTENEIAIGLERYLGANSEPIKKYLDPRVFYKWIVDGMDAKFMERDVLAGWISTHIVDESEGNLAERMIRWGKVLYFTKAAFPEMADNLIMRYSEDGWDWAVKSELDFWKYLIDQKALFGTEDLNVMNMINPGPTTSGLPEKGAPDRMGQFMGYRMVQNYMEVKEIPLSKLAKVSYNDILQEYEIED